MNRIYEGGKNEPLQAAPTIRNGPIGHNIRNTMSINGVSSNIQHSISKRCFRSPPFPAFVRRNYIGVSPKFPLRFNWNVVYTKHVLCFFPRLRAAKASGAGDVLSGMAGCGLGQQGGGGRPCWRLRRME